MDMGKAGEGLVCMVLLLAISMEFFITKETVKEILN